MKLIATLSLLLFFYFSTNAQYNRGMKLLSGTISIGSEKQENSPYSPDAKTTSINVRPSLGKFYANNRLIGVFAQFSSYKRTDVPVSQSIGGGVFLRQYMPLGKSSFSIYMHEELFASFGKDYENTLPGPNVKIKTTYATLAVRPALAYGLTKKLQLELQLVDLLSIGYTRRTPTGDESESVVKRSSFYASTGLTSAPLASFGLGMSLLF